MWEEGEIAAIVRCGDFEFHSLAVYGLNKGNKGHGGSALFNDRENFNRKRPNQRPGERASNARDSKRSAPPLALEDSHSKSSRVVSKS